MPTEFTFVDGFATESRFPYASPTSDALPQLFGSVNESAAFHNISPPLPVSTAGTASQNAVPMLNPYVPLSPALTPFPHTRHRNIFPESAPRAWRGHNVIIIIIIIINGPSGAMESHSTT
jgi:hypothetical protein